MFNSKGMKQARCRPVARLDFRGCGTPESGPFGPNPPYKTPFLAHFVAKSEPFGRFGVVHHTPPWLRAWQGVSILLCCNILYEEIKRLAFSKLT